MARPKEIITPGGLTTLPDDGRDFSLTTVFGSPAVEELPKGDWSVGDPQEIKDQDINYPSDYCAAYAATEVSEDQELVPLVPEWTFAKAKQLLIKDAGATSEEDIAQIIGSYGLNLRDICRAACTYGFLERQYDPFKCNTEDRPVREKIADYRFWPEDLDMLGAEHRKASFFACDGPYDTFDKLRAAMWLNRREQRSILTGVLWRRSFSAAVGGLIEDRDYSGEAGSGHALKVFAQILIRGELYLVAQLSNGPLAGDKGLYYFPRSVINKEFTFGSFTFKDMSRDIAQFHNDNKVAVDASPFYKLYRVLLTWLAGLTHKN